MLFINDDCLCSKIHSRDRLIAWLKQELNGKVQLHLLDHLLNIRYKEELRAEYLFCLPETIEKNK